LSMAAVPESIEPRLPLSRERILRAALAIADEQGIDALSMRKLAQALGFEAMSLYNHVANKHDLYDQLELLDALALAQRLEGTLESVVVDAFPGKPGFRGLGELMPDELETLWPERREVTGETLAEAAAAWQAFRAPDPVALAELAPERLPFLGAAFERLLEELPGIEDGLSRTERQALQVIADQELTPFRAFLATQDLEEAPFHGDAWFFRALSALGRGEARLLEADGGELPAPPPLSDGQAFARLRLRLTDAGDRVLRGEADRVELLGVDRWIGGTHVTTASGWRWDADSRSVYAVS